MKEPLIQIKHGAKVFDNDHAALTNIDLEVPQGSIFGIIGGSGAGKSTLLRCIAGLDSFSSGTCVVSPLALGKTGMIFQHFNLLSSKTALENVMLPLEIRGLGGKEKRAKELLALVGLKGKEDLYPLKMSGGERQRVAIARALAVDPVLLLSDEATASLDPQATRSILNLLVKLNDEFKLTVFLITHQMEVIKEICTDVAVLERGEIVEKGSVSDLFAAPRHPTTRAFLQSLTHEIPEYLSSKRIEAELLRLTFRAKTASEPLISRVIKQFDVEVNILLGRIDVLRSETVGSLVIELSGEPLEREKARSYLESKGVLTEKLLPSR